MVLTLCIKIFICIKQVIVVVISLNKTQKRIDTVV